MSDREKIIKEINLILKYELDEGILIRDKNGKLKHAILEPTEIDPDIFIGIEDLFE